MGPSGSEARRTTARPPVWGRALRRAVRARLGLLLAAAVFTAACGDDDPFRSAATVQNAVTGVSMAGFSTGTAAPSALDLISLRVVRPELQGTGQVNFQLALDVDGTGRVTLLPALALLAPPNGATSVGLQRANGAFDNVVRAPTGGFVRDSAVTTRPGETWLLEVQAGVCAFGEPFYGKLEVEGVNVNTRRLVVRFLINRNCGYRDLTIGLPRN